MKRLAQLLLVIAALVCVPSIAHGQAPEQKLFTDCGIATFQHEVSLSPEVLKVLLATPEASEAVDSALDSADPRRTHPASLFMGAEVHLSSADEVDLVVCGRPPLTGADNVWYWVVRSAQKNPKVVLFATGDSLEELDSKTNGVRDVRSSWSSPNETLTVMYHFDGTEYKAGERHDQENSR